MDSAICALSICAHTQYDAEGIGNGLCYILYGFLGVDMMVCRQKEGHPYAINPHVEINLRMNMGIVSHVLSDHFIVPGGRDISPSIAFRPMKL